MRKFLQDSVTEIAYYLEIMLSVILAVALLFLSFSLMGQLAGLCLLLAMWSSFTKRF